MTIHSALCQLGIGLLALGIACTSSRAASRYGEDFVRLGGHWPEASAWLPPGSEERQVNPLDSELLRQLESRLQVREQAAGPYVASLAEPLTELGSLYRKVGDLDSSLRVYQRALHIVRINNGLYSEHQLPLLRQMLDVQRLRGDWQALDAHYDYYFRALSVTAADDLNPVLDYLRWQRQALRLDIDSREDQRLLRLLALNGELLQEDGAALDARSYWAVLESQLYNLYLLQAWQAPLVSQQSTGLRSTAFNEPPLMLSSREQRLINRQRGAVGEGVALLERFLARVEVEDVAFVARVRLALADWEQWNGRQRSALQRYTELVAWLEKQNRGDLRRAWFAEPVELPDNGVFWRLPEEEVGHIAADFSVSSEGRVRSVETRASGGAGRGLVIRLHRHLLATRFRPAFDIGAEPKGIAVVKRNYLVVSSQ